MMMYTVYSICEVFFLFVCRLKLVPAINHSLGSSKIIKFYSELF
jgi:hypothetical protein